MAERSKFQHHLEPVRQEGFEYPNRLTRVARPAQRLGGAGGAHGLDCSAAGPAAKRFSAAGWALPDAP